ncbi:hypothetical protein FRB93_000985 [Tulasnella sp. JGI-2019a]|nr:hypothetical protein FRB93_000985 [Tulasnella sp. JGI-2019a]
MSSDEDTNVIHDGGFRVLSGLADSEIPKRRKVFRACDICRMRKIRCDAYSERNMEKCSFCATHKLECTFIQGSKKRSPPKSDTTTPRPGRDILYRYIEDLEVRIALLEKLLRRVAPTVNIDTEVGPSFNLQTWQAVKEKSLSSHMASATQVAAAFPTLHVLPHATSFTTSKDFQSRFSSPAQPSIRSNNPPVQEELEPSDGESNLRRDDETGGGFLEKEMEKLSLGDVVEKKFLGKSSGLSVVRAALALKDTVGGNTRNIHEMFKHGDISPRQKFWKPSPWEWMAVASLAINSVRFPPPDLIRTLIDHCFDDVLSLMPVLHRPSFEKQYAEEKHRTDLDFARLLLTVCSVGARTVKDARVCLTSPEGNIEWNSAGWMYFTQVHQLTKPILASAKLVDLQIMALSATYLEGTASSAGAWLINGIGVRFAEDVGAHRNTVYSSTHPFDQQMWKRTFWCLVQKDRQLSAGLGRPMCIHDDDIDLQPPLEVDDDGWDEAKQSWVQPVGKPSQLTFLVQQSKLMGILTNCMRTVYCINKSKVRLGFVGAEWEQDKGGYKTFRIAVSLPCLTNRESKVSELDSALNEWQEALPDHLRWDPHMGPAFYQQAATLRITFFYIQIIIHRPLIQLSSSSKRALSLPSLAVCTNAARSVAHILEITMDMPSSSVSVLASLNSGVMLMISIWEAQRSGLNVDMTAEVHVFLRYLKRWEDRYHLSGRMYDILRLITSISDIPLPELSRANPPHTTTYNHGNAPKRSRDDDSPTHDNRSELSQSTMSGPSSSLAPQYVTGFSDKTPPRSTAEHIAPFADPLQYTQTSTGFTNLNNAVYATNGLGGFALPPLPVNLWPPQSGGYGSEPLSVPESTWQSFPISGSGVSGLGMGFQGLPGYDAQEMDWHELLGPLVPDKTNDTLNTQPEHWNGDPKNQWDWLNQVPDVSVTPFTVPRPAQ